METIDLTLHYPSSIDAMIPQCQEGITDLVLTFTDIVIEFIVRFGYFSSLLLMVDDSFHSSYERNINYSWRRIGIRE